jgi:hypothetical protein
MQIVHCQRCQVDLKLILNCGAYRSGAVPDAGLAQPSPVACAQDQCSSCGALGCEEAAHRCNFDLLGCIPDGESC